MTRRTKWLFGTLIALSGFNPVLATTTSTRMQVTAQVTPGCTSLTVTPLAFGQVPANNSRFNGSATVTVSCLEGVAFDVRMDNGQNADPASQQRKMTDGRFHMLNYEIFLDAGKSQPWHDGIAPGTFRLNGIGTGSPLAFVAFGEAAPLTGQAPGSYTDSVTVDLNF
jgi:spore coat protein U-like protein